MNVFFRSVLLICCFSMTAHNSNSALSNDSVSYDDTGFRILNELQEIHKLQIESNIERDRIREEYKNNQRSAEIVPSNEYDAMLNIADNTKQEFLKDDWNLFGWVTFAIALFSFIASLVTAWQQHKTEQHTQNAPKSVQTAVLKDLSRHFYRNLVCTCALLFLFRHKNNVKNNQRISYPSEANLLKLSTLPDEFILPIDATDSKIFKEMHEKKLLFRNYNLEIEIASKHFSIKSISDDSLKNDYDNLLFKPFFLVSKMLELQKTLNSNKKKKTTNRLYNLFNLMSRMVESIKKLYSKNKRDQFTDTNLPYAIYAIVKEHFNKVKYDLIANKNELSLLKEIQSGDSFVRSIGIKPDSIERGIKELLKSSENTEQAFLYRNENSNNVTIDRAKFIEYFNHYYISEEPKTQTDIDGYKRFSMVVIENVNPFNTEDDNVKNTMKPYFDLFQKKGWDMKELIFNLLKVDTVLETSKIGMIEYQ